MVYVAIFYWVGDDCRFISQTLKSVRLARKYIKRKLRMLNRADLRLESVRIEKFY